MSRFDSDLDYAEWLNGPDPADVVAREDEQLAEAIADDAALVCPSDDDVLQETR